MKTFTGRELISAIRSSADRQTCALTPVARAAEDLQVLRVTAATHRHGDDVVELKLRLGAALSTPATIPHPDQLLDIVGDDIPASHLILWLPAHCSHRLGSFDAAAVSLLL
jgi:hypothetical protein